MHALAVRYPGYLWERNVGYSTAAHFAGIAAHGVTRHHRHSFLPVRQLGLPFDIVAAPDEHGDEVEHLTIDGSLSDSPEVGEAQLINGATDQRRT